jgi:transcriptional regulator with PAS, ATPase and Fis domain
MPLDLESPDRVRSEDLTALLDHLSEGVLVFDRQGRILSINRAACEMLETAPGEAVGCHIRRLLADRLDGAPSSAMPGDDSPDGRPDRDPQGHLTAEAIEESLLIAGWNIAKAARLLGVSRTTLYKRIRSLDLHRPREPRRPR